MSQHIRIEGVTRQNGESMATGRRIIACLDGTWASDTDQTNISWIAKNCSRRGAGDEEQRVGYFPGVGTRIDERFRGGIFGLGLSRQLLDAYRFIRKNWQGPDDEIFIFGFSRGAFAARSLANFIGMVGCLDTDDEDITRKAYEDWYRIASDPDPEALALAKDTREVVQPHIRPAGIAFLGVFDTVGTLGSSALVTRNGLIGQLRMIAGVNTLEEKIHDVSLRDHVARAYHAVAIDEDLEPFSPVLWGIGHGFLDREEVWFPGGHGEVGGGHLGNEDNRDLAKVPLLWMMNAAVGAGLLLEENSLENLTRIANPLAPQHNAPPRVEPRVVRLLELRGQRAPRKIPEEAEISEAVGERLGQTIEIRDIRGKTVSVGPYRPSNLPASWFGFGQ
jgi:uncharacterized protein (DUF2235 family)